MNLDGRRNLATAGLWLMAQPRLGSAAAIVVDGWVMNEQLFRADQTAGRLREAYLALTLGPVDIRAGQQIIAWGRADRINPTDNLTPRDFTLLVVDDADRRSGTPAVLGTVCRDSLSFTAVWLAGFTPDTVPISVPAPVASLAEQTPGGVLGQWAVKLDHTGKAIDWSVSYFDGFDLIPNLGIGGSDGAGVELVQRHPRIQVVGADAAVAVGRPLRTAGGGRLYPHRGPARHRPGHVVVVGSSYRAATLRVREFLTRNGHPYAYVDLDHEGDIPGAARSVRARHRRRAGRDLPRQRGAPQPDRRADRRLPRLQRRDRPGTAP